MKWFTYLYLTLSISLSSQAGEVARCQDLFFKAGLAEPTEISLATLRELALLRVEAENHPDDQMRSWFLKVVEAKVNELIQGNSAIAAQILPKLQKLIEMARVSQSELSKQNLDQLQQEIAHLQRTTQLNVLNLIQTPFRLHDLTRFDGVEASQPETHWLTPRGHELPYSRGGILWSKNEKYMMLRPHYWTSQYKKTVIYDMKTRRPLKYAPRRGLMGPRSDYFAEVLDRHSMRIVDLGTGKVLIKAEGVPVPDSNAFTNDFIISRIEKGRGKNKQISYRLNLFDGRTLDIGKGFALAANGNLLFLSEGRLNIVDAATLKSITLPSHLQGPAMISEKEFSQSTDLVLNGELVRVFVDDLSSVKLSPSPSFKVVQGHVEMASHYSLGTATFSIRDLSQSKQATFNGEFIGFQDNIKMLLFYDAQKDQTQFFDIKTFQTVSYAGRWDQMTEDRSFLLRQGDTFRNAVLWDTTAGIEQTFSKPGPVYYLPENKSWLVHTFKPREQIEVMLVADPGAVELGHRISWTHEGVGLSPSRRFWTVVENEQVRVLEVKPPYERAP